jgi:hypothetical protein
MAHHAPTRSGWPGGAAVTSKFYERPSNLVAVARLLPEADDPEVCGPAPDQRYCPHRKRATISMPSLLLSATGVGQTRPPGTVGDEYPRKGEGRCPPACASDLLVATSRDDGERPDARVLTGGKSALVRGPHLTGVATDIEPGLCRSHNPR